MRGSICPCQKGLGLRLTLRGLALNSEVPEARRGLWQESPEDKLHLAIENGFGLGFWVLVLGFRV